MHLQKSAYEFIDTFGFFLSAELRRVERTRTCTHSNDTHTFRMHAHMSRYSSLLLIVVFFLYFFLFYFYFFCIYFLRTQASAAPLAGTAPLLVRFSSDRSSDPQRRPMQFQWDFGDGSATSTQPNPSHTYATTGIFTATLTITVAGSVSTSTVVINTQSFVPRVSIVQPSATGAATYTPGQTITFTCDVSVNPAPVAIRYVCPAAAL